ncbi:hypothetical protein D3C76_1439240 [compost metagenome]
MHQPGMIPAAFEDGPDQIVFAKGIQLAYEFNLQPIILGDLLGVLPNGLPMTVCLIGIVENLDAVAV